MKVLVVVLDNLGDAVMGSAVLDPLHKHIPSAQIGLWVKEYAAGLFENHPMVSKVHACDPFWDGSPGRQKGSWRAFWKTLNGIRGERYDAALILNAEWRRSAACWWAGIPQRIGFARRKSRCFLTETLSADEAGPHFIDDHRRMLEHWLKRKFSNDECVPKLFVDPADKLWWEKRLHDRFGARTTYMAVHPFTGDERKCWPWDNWKALLKDLSERGVGERFVILTGLGEGVNLNEMGLEKVGMVLSAEPLSRIKAVLESARLFIGGDSGPGHIAAALGTPVVSLFGPTDPSRSGPTGQAPIRLIRENPLQNLSVDRVKREILSELKST